MCYNAHRLWAVLLAATALLLTVSPARAIVAGDTNPPKDGSGNYLYPPDDPDSTYNPTLQTGRLDTLGLNSPFSGVGSINGGTGTLIDPTHVLTAAHLFGQNFSNTGATFVVDTGNGTTQSFQSSAVYVPPQFQGVGVNDDYDIAIVTLDTPVTSVIPNIKTYSIYLDPILTGTTLTLVGYGQTGDGVRGYAGTKTNPNTYPGGRRVGENNADGSLTSDGTVTTTYQAGQSGSQTYVYDFDGPTTGPNQAPNFLGGPTLGNQQETTIGVGDSGGPAFISVNGQYEVAAINNFRVSFQYSDNRDIGYFGSGGGGAVVSAYANFIANADPAAAPEPNGLAAFGAFLLVLLGRIARARRRQGTSRTTAGLPE